MKKLYVGNIPFSFDDNELRKVFEPYGQVLSSRVITDRGSGRSKGFGFVEMEDADAVAAINAVNGTQVGERSIRVDEAQAREEGSRGPGGPRPGGRGNFRGGHGAGGNRPHRGGGNGGQRGDRFGGRGGDSWGGRRDGGDRD